LREGPAPLLYFDTRSIAASFPPAINMVTAQRRANVRHLLLMAKWKQYELWAQSAQNKWEIVGLFPSTELPTVMANARTARTRLIEVVYDGSKMMGQEIIAELGTTRKE
jgi:uncharacterized membrane protein